MAKEYDENWMLPDDEQPLGFVSGADVKMGRIQWLWPGMIVKGALNLIDGGKGVGKSSIMAAMCATVCGGKPLPETKAKGKKSRCLWFGTEESFETAILPRWKANGGNPKDLYTPQSVSLDAADPLYLPGGEARLLWTVQKLGVSMIALDPYSSLSTPGVNLNMEQECRAYLQSLARVCGATGATSLLARHFRKGQSGGFLERGLGSIAVPNVCRSVMRADRDKDNPETCWLSAVSCNHGKAEGAMPYTLEATKDAVFKVIFGRRVDKTIEEILEGHEELDTRDESRDARKLLERSLASGPVDAKTIIREARDAGIGERTLRKAKAEMRIGSKREAAAKGVVAVWKWFMPKAKEGGAEK